MAARTRTRPRAARGQSRPSSRKQSNHRPSKWFTRPDVLGAIAVVAALVVAGVLFDGARMAADARDWTLERFGLGVLVICGWVLYAAAAVWRGWVRQGAAFVRQAAGVAALGLFIWGLFGLNEADWSAGEVDFAKATLGGDFGRAWSTGSWGSSRG